MKKELTLVERIVARLTGNDDKSRVSRFHKRLVKQVDNALKVAESGLDDLEAKLEDAKEQLTDAIEIIEIGKLGTVESTDAYILEYNAKVTKAEQKVAKIEEEIAVVKEQIAAGQKRKAVII